MSIQADHPKKTQNGKGMQRLASTRIYRQSKVERACKLAHHKHFTHPTTVLCSVRSARAQPRKAYLTIKGCYG